MLPLMMMFDDDADDADDALLLKSEVKEVIVTAMGLRDWNIVRDLSSLVKARLYSFRVDSPPWF